MPKSAKFEKLTKVPGTSNLVQGVKNNCVPRNAVAGGNGSFIVVDRAKLILSVKDEDGQVITRDIYLDVKSYTTRRITDKFYEEIKAKMLNFDFQVSNGNIINLNNVLAAL